MLTNETLPDAVGAQVERGVGRHRASDDEATQFPITPSRWVCIRCDRHRRTNFCHVCGAERPPIEDDSKGNLDALRQFAKALRSAEQGQRNTAKHYSEKPDEIGADGYSTNHKKMVASHLKKAEQLRRQASCIEWAIVALTPNVELTGLSRHGGSSDDTR